MVSTKKSLKDSSTEERKFVLTMTDGGVDKEVFFSARNVSGVWFATVSSKDVDEQSLDEIHKQVKALNQL